MPFGKSQDHRSLVAGKVFEGSEQSAHTCLLLLSQALSAVLLKTDFGTDRWLIWYDNSNLLEVCYSNFYRLQAVFSSLIQSKIFSTEVTFLDQDQMSTQLYCCDTSLLFLRWLEPLANIPCCILSFLWYYEFICCSPNDENVHLHLKSWPSVFYIGKNISGSQKYTIISEFMPLNIHSNPWAILANRDEIQIASQYSWLLPAMAGNYTVKIAVSYWSASKAYIYKSGLSTPFLFYFYIDPLQSCYFYCS